MFHTFESLPSLASELVTAGSPPHARQMVASLHALALGLGGHFADLTLATRRRLAIACNGFAELIRAGEDTPDLGMNSRASACFLLSALFELRSTEGALPLSDEEETWMVAEIEADFGEALALFEARTGRPRSPVPPRPQIGRLGLVSA